MPIPSSPERGCLAIVIDVVFPEATPALAQVLVLFVCWLQNGLVFLVCTQLTLQIASILHAACGSSERWAGCTLHVTLLSSHKLYLRRFAGLTGEEEEVVSRPVSELEMQVIRCQLHHQL